MSLTLAFLAAASIILFWRIHDLALFEPDEGRYSEMSLHMVQTGDWMVPHMNGIVHLHKPPLINWLVASSFSFLGFSEFAARLPSILFGLCLLFFLIRLGMFLFDFNSGYYSGWILLTSALYIVTCRLVTTDIALTFFTFMTMYSFAGLFFSNRYKLIFFYMAFIFLGLGMLTKGPVAWMITLTPAVTFALWRKKGFRIPFIHWLLGFGIFAVIALSWYIWIIVNLPGAFDYLVHYQLLGRIFKGNTGHAHPFFYYFWILPLGFLPWTVFMPSALSYLLKNKSFDRETRDKIFFLLLWFLVPFIFFSVFRTKLATYVIPLFPPLALLAGLFWKKCDEQAVSATRAFKASTWLMTSVYFLFPTGGIIFTLFRPKFIEGINRLDMALAFAVFLTAFVIQACFLLKNKYTRIFKFQTAILCLIAIISFDALPSIHFKNAKAFAETILKLQKPGDEIIMYRDYIASLPFYLKKRIIEVGIATETTFEDPEELKKYVFPRWEDIEPFLLGSARVFVMADKNSYKQVRQTTKARIYPLFTQENFILFSNQS